MGFRTRATSTFMLAFLACFLPGAIAGDVAAKPGQATSAPDVPSTAGPTTAATPEEIAQLIQDLGSPLFSARERASRKLVELGIITRAAVAEAASAEDAEVRLRARAVLSAISDADFRERLAAFSADLDGSQKQTLPGWGKFSALMGTSPLARQLFVEMQRAEPELLDALAAGGKPLSEALNARCQALLQQFMHGQRESQMSLGTVASLLLAGSTEGVSVDEQTGIQLFSMMIYQPSFKQNITTSDQAAMLKKLLGMWVVKEANATATAQNLMIAATFELKPEGLKLGTRVLADAKFPANTRQYAVLIVGKFGGREQVPLVEKLLEDKTSCGMLQANNPPRRIEIQIRDIALAVALHLTGQNLREYGYVAAQPNPTILFQVASLNFADSTMRDAALKKWNRWRAEHPAP